MRRLAVGLAVLMIAGLASSWAHADDQQIAREIAKKLREEQSQGDLRSFSIDLEVDNGTVWMKGHVASGQQQQLALDIARRVSGVQQVVNDLKITPAAPLWAVEKAESRSPRQSPSGETRRPALLTGFRGFAKRSGSADDSLQKPTTSASPAAANSEQLATAVVESLRKEKEAGKLRNFDLAVKAQEGNVFLSGFVASTPQQQLALETARRVPGVKHIVNQLKVKPAAAKSDEPLARPVKAAAANGGEAQKAKPTVSEANNAVGAPNSYGSLEGEAFAKTLQRGQTLDRALLTPFVPLAAASSVEESSLSRRPSRTGTPTVATEAVAPQQLDLLPVRADREIAEEILQKLENLKQQGSLRDFEMDVRVLDGEVWMSGEVSSPQQQQLPLEVARRVAGVVRVVNGLEVKSSTETATTQLAAATAAAAPPQPVLLVPSGYPAPNGYPAFPGYAVANRTPVPFAPARSISYTQAEEGAMAGQPVPEAPAYAPVGGVGIGAVQYDNPQLPAYAWPTYAAYPNYAGVTYPRQYSPTAWPYIGPFYPYPQVPLGWRKVTLAWDDGWWMLDFK